MFIGHQNMSNENTPFPFDSSYHVLIFFLWNFPGLHMALLCIYGNTKLHVQYLFICFAEWSRKWCFLANLTSSKGSIQGERFLKNSIKLFQWAWSLSCRLWPRCSVQSGEKLRHRLHFWKLLSGGLYSVMLIKEGNSAGCCAWIVKTTNRV